MQLDEAVRLFLGEYRATTSTSYKPVLVDMQKYLGERRPLEDIKPHHLVEYRQSIAKRAYSQGTRSKYIKTLKVFWNWCARTDLVEKSPANVLKNERMPAAIDRSKAITDSELKAVLRITHAHPRADALVRFLADTGCRRGGAAGLRVQDVDLINRVAMVTEKGDKTRPVAFGRRTAEAITRWLRKRPGTQGDYIFSRYGEMPTPYAISQLFRRCCISAEVRSLGTHALRHRKGHQMADAGIAPSIAAQALGHEDVMTTLKHYYPHDWESARAALENLSLSDSFDFDSPEE